MGWSVGYDSNWNRDIGYGVPSICDLPGCGKEIDRGLSYVCGGDAYGGEDGCGLFFCESHLDSSSLCPRCEESKPPFDPTPDTEEWIKHKETHPSWEEWRKVRDSKEKNR